MTAPQDPFRAPDGQAGQPAAYGPPPGQPGVAGAAPPYGQPYGQPGGFGAPAAPGQGGYGSPPPTKRNGLGVAAVVLGVLALLTCLFLGGIPFGIAAIVLGALGRGRVTRGEADNGSLALAGLILGALALAVSVGIAALGASFLSENPDSFRNLTSCLEQAQGDDAAEAECRAELEDDLTG